jgi:hypothetical protein
MPKTDRNFCPTCGQHYWPVWWDKKAGKCRFCLAGQKPPPTSLLDPPALSMAGGAGLGYTSNKKDKRS